MPPSKGKQESQLQAETMASMAKTIAAQAGIIERMQAQLDEMVVALRLLSGQVPRASPTENTAAGKPDGKPARRLTKRQRQIAPLVAAGLHNDEIAEQVELDLDTVRSHRAALFKRLDVHSIDELATKSDAWKIQP